MNQTSHNVADAIFAVAEARPDQDAIENDGDLMTYEELVDAVLRAQSLLNAWGIQPGGRVATALRDQTSEILVMLACARAGVVYLPLDTRTTYQEQAALFDLCGGELTLTDSRLPEDPRFRRIESGWWKQGDRAPDTPSPHSGPWAVSLSSGTSGLPSGAVITHEAFFHRIAPLHLLFHDDAPLRYLSVIPLIFSGARTQALYQLIDGNTLVCYPPLFTPEDLVAVIDEKRIDATYVPAAALRRLLELPRGAEPSLCALKYIVSGAAFMSPEEKRLIARYVCPRHYHVFGVSGVGRITTLLPEDLADHADSVGRIQALMEARVQDGDGNALPAGSAGQLSVRGPTVPTEFFGGEPSVDSDGWYRTGDMAELDEEGYLHLRGRTSDFINRGGMNVYTGLVEQQLVKHPRIMEAAVVGRTAANQEQDIIAFVVVDGGIDQDELQSFARAQLSGAAQPAEFRIIDELPKTAAGKVRKGELTKRLS